MKTLILTALLLTTAAVPAWAQVDAREITEANSSDMDGCFGSCKANRYLRPASQRSDGSSQHFVDWMMDSSRKAAPSLSSETLNESGQ